MSAERYVAKRSGSQGPNSPDRWPSLTTSAIVLRQRRSSASRLRAASSLRNARDHNSTHNVQYSSVSRRSTGGQASSIKPHHPLRRALDARQLPESLDVEEVLGVGERLRQQLLLGPEVVDDQRRAQTRPLRHVGDARVAKTPLPDHLRSRLQHLRAALLRQLGPRAHAPPTLYLQICEWLFNAQR